MLFSLLQVWQFFSEAGTFLVGGEYWNLFKIMTGNERLDNLIEGQLDRPLIKVVNYLKSQNSIDESIYLNEEKDLQGMCSYLKSKAKEYAVDGVAVIEDEKVYEWAIHYWKVSNEELGITKPKINQIVNDVHNQNTITKGDKEAQEQLTLGLDL